MCVRWVVARGFGVSCVGRIVCGSLCTKTDGQPLIWAETLLQLHRSKPISLTHKFSPPPWEDNELRLVPGDELRLRYLGDVAHAAVSRACASATKNKGMDNYKQGKYAEAIKWLSWAVILLEKTCDGAASMEVLSSRASCYKEVGEYKKVVVDCTKRNYKVSLPHNKIPDALCQLAKKMAAPAMPGGEEFRPEAAIVNYFGLGDTLGGHLDDMEADWTKPIVSISLGCKAVFLLGGKSRQDLPVAMFLRSGDIVLMAGEARECFHGVPRIFTDEEKAEINPLELQFSQQNDLCLLEYIRTSRININVRQVF